MLVLCILILFGVLIIPSYRLYNPFSEFSFSHSAKLLNEIFKKFLQYFLVAIPVKVFTVITMLIPLAIILVVYWVSFNIKNSVAEVKINKLKLEQTRSNNPVDAYETGKQIERFRCLQQFPEGLLQEMEDRKNLTTKISFSKEDTESAEAGILLKKEENERKQQDLQNQIDSIKKSNLSDINIKTLLKVKDRLQIELIEYRSAQELSLAKLKIDIKYFELKRDQSPYLFFLGGLWIVIFGSIVAAFGISYIGNVFHQVYIFRNNDKKAEWKNIVERIKEKDHKQPLLGGTLFAITLVLLYILLAQSDFVRDILSQIKSLL
jgi:hypothetical protein